MNTSVATNAQYFNPSVWHPVPRLDASLQWAAAKLSRASRISNAGAFWHTAGSLLVSAWMERQEDGSGALIVRLRRLELILDWRAPHSR
jgi:hypothetical protein